MVLLIAMIYSKPRWTRILEGLKGVVSIVDDIAVHGETEEQHDDNMRKLMDRAHENGLISNPDKCSLKAECVMFF